MIKPFFKKVIVAVNGRESSIHAAMYAIMMAKTYNLELKFVYVVDTATIKYLSLNKLLVTDESFDFEARLKTDGQNYLNYVKSLAEEKGIIAETELLKGGVFQKIVECAAAYEADLIILGGNEPSGRNIQGRKNLLTTEQTEILAVARCPYMIVQKANIEAEFKIFR